MKTITRPSKLNFEDPIFSITLEQLEEENQVCLTEMKMKRAKFYDIQTKDKRMDEIRKAYKKTLHKESMAKKYREKKKTAKSKGFENPKKYNDAVLLSRELGFDNISEAIGSIGLKEFNRRLKIVG